jgi:ParB-like chromosome segregation protein Spo0J
VSEAFLLKEAADEGERAAVLRLRVAGLVAVGGLRERGLDEDHVRRLMETGGEWPPILVWGSEDLVLDGAHRLAAAERIGLDSIRAVRFTGTWPEAYVEAVRQNVAHGLPLTLRERTAAVRRVLQATPEWSDRRISAACGLSDKTVARLRRQAGAGAGVQTRVGRDGRARPVQPEAVREKIAVALRQYPDRSLRAIAADVGASPETVRGVRRRSRTDPLEAPPLPAPSSPVLRVVPAAGRPPSPWRQDTALASAPSSQAFLDWFESTDVGADWCAYPASVPLSRVYEIADEARRRARSWLQFADALEGRVRPARA